MEEVDASRTRYQYGSRELQLFQSDLYAGECMYTYNTLFNCYIVKYIR